MAGLWEQVGGVFWGVPPVPAPVEEARPLATIIMGGVVAAFVITAALKYVLHKMRPQGWGMRKHLGAVGAAVTLAYMAIILPVIWDRVDTLLTMPLNEVGDFLAGAFGPIAFFWLVLGFFQQGEELRQGTEALLLQATELKNSVQQQSIMAKAAIEQREERREASKVERIRRAKEIEVKLSLRTGSSGMTDANNKVLNEVKITNAGHHASNVTLRMDDLHADSVTIRIGDIEARSTKSTTLRLTRGVGTVSGVAVLHYEDADDAPNMTSFNYTITNNRIEFDND